MFIQTSCQAIPHNHGNQFPEIQVTANAPTSIWERFKNHLAVRRQRKQDREAFSQLLSLDNDILKDIGLSRADIVWASKLPVHENASQCLKKVSDRNRRIA